MVSAARASMVHVGQEQELIGAGPFFSLAPPRRNAVRPRDILTAENFVHSQSGLTFTLGGRSQTQSLTISHVSSLVPFSHSSWQAPTIPDQVDDRASRHGSSDVEMSRSSARQEEDEAHDPVDRRPAVLDKVDDRERRGEGKSCTSVFRSSVFIIRISRQHF